MKRETRIGAVRPQAEGCAQPPGAGGGRKDPPQSLRRHSPRHLELGLWPLELREDNPCGFKLPGQGGCVTAALTGFPDASP